MCVRGLVGLPLFPASYFSITAAQVFCVRAEWERLGPDRRQLVRTTLDLFYLSRWACTLSPLFSSCKNRFFCVLTRDRGGLWLSVVRARSSAEFNFASFSLALQLGALFVIVLFCLLGQETRWNISVAARLRPKVELALGKRWCFDWNRNCLSTDELGDNKQGGKTALIQFNDAILATWGALLLLIWNRISYCAKPVSSNWIWQIYRHGKGAAGDNNK